jgi:hypothetical protein
MFMVIRTQLTHIITTKVVVPLYLFILYVSCNFNDFSMLMFGLISGVGIPPLNQQQLTAFATPPQQLSELPDWFFEGEKLVSARTE